jgi:hypothetical protein
MTSGGFDRNKTDTIERIGRERKTSLVSSYHSKGAVFWSQNCRKLGTATEFVSECKTGTMYFLSWRMEVTNSPY